MNVLRVIGASFTKFWRWIRETAWVQPLLIVGAIFAVIFSIPKFTAWFGAMGVNSSDSYYNSFRLSLENEGAENENGDAINTAADKITAAINYWSFDAEKAYNNYDEYRAALQQAGVIGDYGEKFYLVYVESDCSGCENAQTGFELLTTGWNTTFEIGDDYPFRIHSIFADEVSTNDSDYELEEDKVAFNRYLRRFDEEDLWARAAGRLHDAPYRLNKSVSETNYTYIEEVDVNNWQTPSIFLIDFSKAAYDAGRVGVSEVLFGVSGSTSYDYANLLLDMWNHVPTSDSDRDTKNPFRVEYIG